MKRESIFYTLVIALMLASNTFAGEIGNYIFIDEPYLLSSDSPFDLSGPDSDFLLENFEDGLINSLGLYGFDGEIRNPSNFTDSVDIDDGVVDGFGQEGHSYWAFADAENGPHARFEFDVKALGYFPTAVGLVWTDGNPSATIVFEAFGPDGKSLGVMQLSGLGDGNGQGGTDEDRFMGVTFDGGISAIELRADMGRIEMDHVQYGEFVPAPGILGLLGMGGLFGLGRRSRRHRPLKRAAPLRLLA